MTRRIRTVTLVTVLLAAGHGAPAADLRTEGTRVFEERLARLGRLAREHDDVTERIRESCLGRVVLDTKSGQVTGVLSSTCQSLRNDAGRLEAEMRDGIARAKDDARRAGVYPGTVRSGIRREGLEAFSD